MNRKFFISCFKLLLFTISFSLFFVVSANSYAQNVNQNLSSSFFRFHVVANSNSKVDQDLKYQVRDALISHMNTLCENVSQKEDAIQIAKNHLSSFETIAKQTILSNGFDYPVKVEVGNFPFPTKNYGEISLPSGYYDALKVTIGNGGGENWWCVMFPPLCFIDPTTGVVEEETMQEIQNSLSKEEISLIESETENTNQEITFKFKIVEFFQNAKIFLSEENS